MVFQEMEAGPSITNYRTASRKAVNPIRVTINIKIEIIRGRQKKALPWGRLEITKKTYGRIPISLSWILHKLAENVDWVGDVRPGNRKIYKAAN